MAIGRGRIWGWRSNVRTLGRSRALAGSVRSRTSAACITVMNALQHNVMLTGAFLANDRLVMMILVEELKRKGTPCQVLQKRILGLRSPLPFEFFNQSHHYQPPAAQAAARLPSAPPSDEASPARAATRLPCQFFHPAYSTSAAAFRPPATAPVSVPSTVL